MKDYKSNVEIDGVDYPMAFTLNVMQEIQEKYETIDNWGNLTDGISGEVNVKALIFGYTEMINEGIEIENEEKGEKRKLLTKKQVGRLLTSFGMQRSSEKLNEIVIESTKSDEKNT